MANVGFFNPATRPVPYTRNAAYWGPDHNSRCPCDSGKLAGDCHVNRARGNWKLPWYKPPLQGSRTGVSCQGCYVAFTNDCSPKLSSEHWLSKRIILELFPKGKVPIYGLRGPGQSIVQTGDFAAHILCERHNNALSKLDATAVEVFKTLRHYQKDQQTQPDPHGSEFDLFSGECLERWMLKLLWGGVAAGVFTPGLYTKADPKILADYLFRDRKLPADWGLGITFRSGETIRGEGEIALRTAVAPDGTVAKIVVSMGAVSFGFGLGRQIAKRTYTFSHRPQAVILKSQLDIAEKTLALGWDQRAPGRPLDYTYIKAKAS